MADYSSLTSTSQATSAASQSDQLVAAYKQTQQSKIDALSTKKKTLESRQALFTTLNTKLNNLLANIDKFDSATDAEKFITRTISSNNTSVATVSATKDATIGVNTLKVERLASNDVLISNQMGIGSSDTFGTNGDNLKFKINGVEVSVNLAAGISNENAMKAIVSAVNAKTDTKVTASYIKDTSTTARLTFTSTNTGTDNKITFDDNSSGVLNQLGFNNVDSSATDRTQITNSGNQYAHYKLSTAASLDSKININGIDVLRSSNTLTDVLPGVTINLLKTQETSDAAVTLNTDANPSAAQSLINPLLTSYNDLLNYLKQNSSEIRNESAVSSLNYKLRTAVTQAITPSDSSDPKYIMDIGIKFGTDGTLSVGDSTTFASVLKSDPDKVANLFVGTDGLASRLKNAVKNLIGDDGIINSRKVTISKEIQTNITKTREVTERIDKQAESLRSEYQDMLQVYLNAQSQYSSLSSLFSY